MFRANGVLIIETYPGVSQQNDDRLAKHAKLFNGKAARLVALEFKTRFQVETSHELLKINRNKTLSVVDGLDTKIKIINGSLYR